MTTLCWLHPEGREHEATKPAGLLLDTGVVIPIDTSCRNAETAITSDAMIVDASWVNVGAVRS